MIVIIPARVARKKPYVIPIKRFSDIHNLIDFQWAEFLLSNQ
jgi:hypothetical protein